MIYREPSRLSGCLAQLFTLGQRALVSVYKYKHVDEAHTGQRSLKRCGILQRADDGRQLARNELAVRLLWRE